MELFVELNNCDVIIVFFEIYQCKNFSEVIKDNKSEAKKSYNFLYLHIITVFYYIEL